MISEGSFKEGYAVRTCNFSRAVRAPGVHHHNFVGDSRKRSQGARQVVFLIERNQAGGEAVHRTPANSEIALVSHNAYRRDWSTDKTALRRRETRLLRLEIHANHAATDSKLGTVPQHGRAHAFFVEESAVVESMSLRLMYVSLTSSKQ